MLGVGEIGEWLNPPIGLNCAFCCWNDALLVLNVDELEWDPFSWEVDEEDEDEDDDEDDEDEDDVVVLAWLVEPNVISL